MTAKTTLSVIIAARIRATLIDKPLTFAVLPGWEGEEKAVGTLLQPSSHGSGHPAGIPRPIRLL